MIVGRASPLAIFWSGVGARKPFVDGSGAAGLLFCARYVVRDPRAAMERERMLTRATFGWIVLAAAFSAAAGLGCNGTPPPPEPDPNAPTQEDLAERDQQIGELQQQLGASESARESAQTGRQQAVEQRDELQERVNELEAQTSSLREENEGLREQLQSVGRNDNEVSFPSEIEIVAYPQAEQPALPTGYDRALAGPISLVYPADGARWSLETQFDLLAPTRFVLTDEETDAELTVEITDHALWNLRDPLRDIRAEFDALAEQFDDSYSVQFEENIGPADLIAGAPGHSGLLRLTGSGEPLLVRYAAAMFRSQSEPNRVWSVRMTFQHPIDQADAFEQVWTDVAGSVWVPSASETSE